MELNTPLTALPGVGPARARSLEKLGLRTVGDLLGYYPRDYEDRTKRYAIAQAPADTPVCVSAMVAETPRLSRIRKGLELTRVKVVDGSAAMTLTFFNQSYVRDALVPGQEYIFYGRVEGDRGGRQMTNPVFEREDRARFTGRILPVYPLTAGVSNNLLAGLAQRAVEECACQVAETLPADLLEAHDLAPAEFSCRSIHFPQDFDALARAKRRLVFEELFTLSAGLALLRQRRSGGEGPAFPACDPADFYALLPFAPTEAQRRTISECAADLTSGRPMNRLVQGDVGSGKTAVAAACAWMAFRSGWQAAMMAPTEILAEQHCRSLSALLAPAGMRVGLLTGSMRAGEKKRVYAALEAGEIDFVVGTHALLSGPVAFRRLGLVVADEQHRFGVEQRAALAAKANTPDCPPEAGRRLCGEGRGDSVPPAANGMDGVPAAACRCGEVEQRAALAAKGEKKTRPHVLVMSATPIPRTLALIIYGDLDVSVIDQLPPGRLPVKTVLVGESKRQRMYGFVREQIRQGRQAYIVCPAIETDPESAAADLKRVVEYAEGLQKQVFPDLRVGLVHGRMKAKDKEAAMAAFARGETHILVSTTVVEVGVDVANATLMIVENADRYGLSQLHQLRGRVGRGEHQSWCVLVSDNRSPETRARLKVLVDTADGFRIAEEDLKLRGPGDFFGRRQHGLPALRMADLNTDTRVLKEARDAAVALLSADPDLSRPEHRPLQEKVRRLFEENPDMFN
ncbi:ATP-dependent DNA helicase RecG [Intestinimonas massiliensis (ex Afouda et al. 2020)]|uniref:Probable DNA 3'-5' helicase RecG n=1 Tax=Intestinimonas massiliensis (ex Afouda et al. 2020) TaxID=1673721 RepID=A0ABS9MCJ4_9FIRM|nr:ATP-dependent DNA helicase RecG [Intestinimonas massiliensis (ex Afouda et al. 2020)]MCG4528547.1 ATP-dependent DNA helicase RecG [Intestinimonas massiliensis (ex Afouda et al. 2020)]